MFKSPYETTVCSQYHLAPVVTGLKYAKVEGSLIPAQTSSGKKYANVYLLSPVAKNLPPFTQPIDIDGDIVVDARAFLTIDRDSNVKVTSPNELDFLILRAALTHVWSQGDQDGLGSLQDFPTRVYSRFVSEALTRRLGLDPLEQLKLSVLAGLFYLTQFKPLALLNEQTKPTFAVKIGRATSIGADKILPILDLITESQPDMSNVLIKSDLESFCSYAKVILTSARSSQINPALLVASVAGSWYGATAKETVAVALEYPPYFNALIYSAITDRSYHSAYLTKLVNQTDRNNNAVGFQRALVEYLNTVES